MVDVSIENAWEIATTYVMKYGTPTKGPESPSSGFQSSSRNRINDYVRYDRIDHFLIYIPNKKDGDVQMKNVVP
ncbi:hypothetical protein JTB14_018734 [Gonioctena quinquepunctata]|nr:hypothetical protein JTB14_018734 [Gonioctena quinquepunctata]